MSEYSESYHLKSINTQDGADLLKRAGLEGFVFPASNGWVTLVVQDSEVMPNEKLIEANSGMLFRFFNAVDEFWYFIIYREKRQICVYQCSWIDGIQFDDIELNMEVLIKLINDNNKDINIKEIKRILHPESFDEALKDPTAAQKLARMIGLTNYKWISYAYVAQSFFEGTGIFPDLIYVK